LICQLIAVRPEGLDCSDLAGKRHLVKVAQQASIWRGKAGASVDSLKPGDELSMGLLRDSSGQLAAIRIWANLRNIRGRICALGSGWVDVCVDTAGDPAVNSVVRAIISKETVVNSGFAGIRDFKMDMELQVIGYGRTNGDEVEATTVFLYDAAGRMVGPKGLPITTPKLR
jgi:hypothetical protein